ncbi:MAG: NAD(P)H-dependent glycerol-3-phosphate dehydrogenase [Chloroherpetonaceae bacterium]|nr:NAD(P)H-dependent glycerol-3-phosphate dehydrogenase [Chloroherpetonaceae bacterium]MCS7211280.1 NAD(P)H-dependent glycerol-3-phosphate dehydrogenase [Chloroherpetonaceae bacterium]MDW8019700.1 NAD(P)H-dependent glycerol-3-phosphate dehydrogenase [Chloroherpetonaceae bacterium]MDW8465217.1 NAD(P)H-dependent glycerol-3-phosphate dehydrogenase [Chloroherpetonaceae bacterium]
MESDIAVLGAGSWGTTLAVLLAEKGYRVFLWAHRKEFAEELSRTRENRRYLAGITLPDTIDISSEIERAQAAQIIVVATPSQAVRETLSHLDAQKVAGAIFVNVSKGIEIGTGMRMSEVTQSVLPTVPLAHITALYGPSHAEEVSRHQPTTVVAASVSKDTAKYVQDVFRTPMFRVYANTDLIGVEIAGSVKNIMAIAAGIADGIGYGDNAKAAIITRGLAEVTRLGVRLGANPRTFSGLAGVGDLVVTCSSKHSRNRYVGEQIGKGKTLEQVLSEMVMVAEGISTTKAVYELAQKLGVEMPITAAVYEMLFHRKNPTELVYELMTREPKEELL